MAEIRMPEPLQAHKGVENETSFIFSVTGKSGQGLLIRRLKSILS
jgi:hypothetical protein